MKIGVLVAMRTGVDIFQKFRDVKALGLNCCQVNVWDMSFHTPENAAALKAASEETGVEITAIWAGWTGPAIWNAIYGPATLGLVPPAYRFERLQQLEKGGEFAAMVGVRDVITHCGFMPEVPSDPDFVGTVAALKTLCGHLKERGQRFLFETGQETPPTLLRAIEAIGMDNVGVNLDTANLILYGKASTLDALDMIGKYVWNTHCKDGFYPTCGSELGREVPLGEGKANIGAVMKKLKELGYPGPWIIEREISGDQQVKDICMARDLLLRLDSET